jgi:dUTP pyrophosphatase
MGVRYVDFKLEGAAKAPYKKHFGDAGWDLFVSRDCVIQPGETVDVHTDIQIDMPPYTYARIVGRSSTLRKHKLIINEGIIDNGYTGELFVCVHNIGNKPFHVKTGMRLAQVLFHVIEDIRWSRVDEIKPKSGGRGNAGFGSTGE